MHQNVNRIYNNNDLIAVYHGLFNTVSETTDWFVWNKPKGVRMVQITAVGGGGGGGSGGAGANGTNRSGGGGGGSGAFSKVIIPAFFLPDVLYVKPGAGGLGAVGVLNSNGQSGSGGNTSYVTIFPSTDAGNTVCLAGGGGGGGAGGTGNSAAGSAGSVGSQTNMPFGFLGITQVIAGTVGAACTAGAAGGSPALNPFLGGPGICTGATAGGGVTTTNTGQVGGNLLSITTTIPYPDTTTPVGTPGRNGFNYGLNINSNPDVIVSHLPLVSTGGTGAGGQGSDTTGQRGACGGFGSGGGGGGAINGTNVTGGSGGNGGPGFVIIVSSY